MVADSDSGQGLLEGEAPHEPRQGRAPSCLRKLVGHVFSETGRDIVRELLLAVVALWILAIARGTTEISTKDSPDECGPVAQQCAVVRQSKLTNVTLLDGDDFRVSANFVSIEAGVGSAHKEIYSSDYHEAFSKFVGSINLSPPFVNQQVSVENRTIHGTDHRCAFFKQVNIGGVDGTVRSHKTRPTYQFSGTYPLASGHTVNFIAITQIADEAWNATGHYRVPPSCPATTAALVRLTEFLSGPLQMHRDDVGGTLADVVAEYVRTQKVQVTSYSKWDWTIWTLAVMPLGFTIFCVWMPRLLPRSCPVAANPSNLEARMAALEAAIT